MRLADHKLDVAKLAGIWWDWETQAPCEANKPHETHGCFLVVPVVASQFDVEAMREQVPYAEMLHKREDAQACDAVLVRTRARALARTILLDWRNVEHADGTPWPYTVEAAESIFRDRCWLSVARQVEAWSMHTQAALAREEDKAKGN